MEKHKPHLRRKVLDNLIDYGPVILSVLVSTIAALRATQTGISSEELLQLVLIILVILSTTQLIDRFRLLRNLENNIETILQTREMTVGLDKVFLTTLPNLSDRLRQAKTITHNGITLVGTSNALLTVFSNCLANGCQIHLIMINPEDKALDVASQRFFKHQDHLRLRREAAHALDNFSSLYSSSHEFVIGFSNVVPPYSIWLIDANTKNAEIWVGLYSYRDTIEPWLHLLPNKDGEMFDFFQRQIESLWKDSSMWEGTIP